MSKLESNLSKLDKRIPKIIAKRQLPTTKVVSL